jgi:hypothetical protein
VNPSKKFTRKNCEAACTQAKRLPGAIHKRGCDSEYFTGAWDCPAESSLVQIRSVGMNQNIPLVQGTVQQGPASSDKERGYESEYSTGAWDCPAGFSHFR